MDILDIRDLIDEFEGLSEELEELEDEGLSHDDIEASFDFDRYEALEVLLDELEGLGGDHQWHGKWFPIMLIPDEDFTEYAQELLQDIGDLPRDIPSYIDINWESTADNIKEDYSSVDFEGTEYWFRP
jgi:hypothetical protein